MRRAALRILQRRVSCCVTVHGTRETHESAALISRGPRVCTVVTVVCVRIQAARALQRMSIEPGVLQKLVNKRVSTARDLLSATQLELVEGLDLSFEAVEQLIFHVCQHVAPSPSTVAAAQLL